jgi:hypothetical protein
MKREFGKKLIEEFFPKIELSHVIDTSGAYIPGHGTPTVILLGRNRRATSDTVRAVLGIKGEPSTPEQASQGHVWQSIVKQIDRAGVQDEFTSTADVPRTSFNSHPWSIGGGGASELLESLISSCDTTLEAVTSVIGVFGMTNADEVFLADKQSFLRQGLSIALIRPFHLGNEIRDWKADEVNYSIFPYTLSEQLIDIEEHQALLKWLWPAKTVLGNRATFGRRTYFEENLPWWKWHQVTLDRLRTPLTIIFPEVASHNHFVFDRGGRVFNQTAPLIKLKADATENDYFGLLGLLNSSTVCFFMKQVSQQKQMTGGDGVRITVRAHVPYQFAGTRLKALPIPESYRYGSIRQRLAGICSNLDRCSVRVSELSARRAVQEGIAAGPHEITRIFGSFEKERSALRSAMVLLQEELDFTSYVMYGLTNPAVLSEQWDWPEVIVDVGSRPFEIIQQSNVDGFEVPKGIPHVWPESLRLLWQSRIAAIMKSKDIALIEDDHYKRRWIGRQGLFNHAARQNELRDACRTWLLDRLETGSYHPQLELRSTARLADIASADPEFLTVATVYRGRPDFDCATLVAELIESESVPFVPVLRYTLAGMRKREIWERTWAEQRQQSLKPKDVTVPPLYTDKDFAKSDFKRLRGPLDVPKERWISYPHCSTDSDPTLVIGWAGWNHLEQATALIAYYDARKREGWDAKRLTPLLAGLDQLLPWIHQWHPEIDAEFGETAGQSYQTMLEHDAHELGLTMEDIRNWTPPEKVKKTPKGRKKKIEAEDDE